MKKIIGIVLGICYSTLVWAQSVEQIKADRSTYLWGEGKGNTLKKADSEALSDLINQITTTIESDFTLLQEEKSESEYKETVKSVIRTYSNATLTNTERIVIENEPDARVFRYMKRSEIDKIFKARKNKILEYLANAETAEEHLQIADALRYYYWSQTLLRSHPEGAAIRYRDKDGEERLAATWIPLKINTLFSHLNITVSRVVPEGNFQTVELTILYNQQPVRNFDYTYWDGRDWSNIVSAKDGRGIAELPALADATHLRVKGEYIFDGEATVDAELKDVINRLDVVPFRSCYIEAYPTQQTSMVGQETVVTGSEEQSQPQAERVASFFKSVSDSERYLPVVKKVEDLSGSDRARFEKMDPKEQKEMLAEAYKFEKPCPEVNVTPEVRQEGYEAFVTTDDHLMHLTGITKDQNGTKYYITKNSWGTERNTFGGYLNMSESYVRAKTIFLMVHKDAIPAAIKQKLGIK